MLEIKELTKEFKTGAFGKKTFKAVNKASFEIDDRDIISLIGESGSGKTTIGRMILRLTQISSGKIIYNGEDISDIKNRDLKKYYRKVQGVFQDPFSTFNPIFKADRIFRMVKSEFYPELSQREWKDKLYESLTSVGLNPNEMLNKYPHQLSGGQLQRFLIARALLINVKLLVADEIISMLDASTRIDVLNLLAMLKEKGLSVLFITHDLSLGYYISNKAIILYKGVIVERGSTDKVFLNPIHPYTQNLLDSVPRLDMKWEDIPKRKELKRNITPFIPGVSKKEPKTIEIDENHFVAVE